MPCSPFPSSFSSSSSPSARDGYLDHTTNVISYHLEDMVGSTQCVVEVQSFGPQGDDKDKIYERFLLLFKLDMPADGSLSLKMRAQKLLTAPDTHVSAYLRFSDATITKRDIPELGDASMSLDSIGPVDGKLGKDVRLQELGIYLQAPYLGEDAVRVAVVQDICISLQPRHACMGDWSIDDIRVEQKGDEETRHWRLCWAFERPEKAQDMKGLPYSDITGLFSYFLLRVDGMAVGRAYATEYVLQESVVEMLKGEGREVEVVGVGFDGRKVAEERVRLKV